MIIDLSINRRKLQFLKLILSLNQEDSLETSLEPSPRPPVGPWTSVWEPPPPLWLSSVVSFSLSVQLERSYQRFTAFYASRHSGRKLTWLYHLSKGELVTNCFKNRYTALCRRPSSQLGGAVWYQLINQFSCLEIDLHLCTLILCVSC